MAAVRYQMARLSRARYPALLGAGGRGDRSEMPGPALPALDGPAEGGGMTRGSQDHAFTEVDFGGQKVAVPAGGYYDRYRMNPGLDVVKGAQLVLNMPRRSGMFDRPGR